MTVDGTATVFIVDDDGELRDSLCQLISKTDFSARPYATADSFLEAYEEPEVGCLLLDLRMPGLTGMELQLELKRRGSQLPIVFLTGHGDIRAAVGAVKRGAFDFVEKPFDNHELLELVAAAIAKSRKDAEQREIQARHLAQFDHLTSREREVHERLIAGKTNKTIGAELDISERTVEFHRANVMKKLQVSTLAELIELSV